MIHLNKLKKKNICIIGLMGSGKSIIGKDLSKYFNLKFYDTDKEIEKKTNKSINAIFKDFIDCLISHYLNFLICIIEF